MITTEATEDRRRGYHAALAGCLALQLAAVAVLVAGGARKVDNLAH